MPSGEISFSVKAGGGRRILGTVPAGREFCLLQNGKGPEARVVRLDQGWGS